MQRRSIFFLLLAGFAFSRSAPVPQNLILVPNRYAVLLSPYQLRGPLSFIGDWINNSDWFPIEFNVPDAFGNLGSGIQGVGTNVGNFFQSAGSNLGNFAQGVGSNLNGFAQNVGNGWNAFQQNWNNRFRNVTFQRPIAVAQNTKLGTKYFVVKPNNLEATDGLSYDPFDESDMFGPLP